MKKIELITIHRNCNYGSVLQTLATQKTFEALGFECEVIDFIRELDTKSGLLRRLKTKSKLFQKNPIALLAAQSVILPSYIKKEKIFNRFLLQNVKMTSQKYYSNEELKGNTPKADAYCTGSDQIWNSHWNEGVEPAYYLDFAPQNSFCFSYSSSIGNLQLKESEKEQMIPYLKKYRYLSVREGASIQTLKQLGFDSVRQMLDPTLYMKPEFWKAFASNRFINRNYVVTYNLHHDKKLDAFAKQLADAKGLELINISYNWHDIARKGKLAWCPTPEEYLGLIRDAQYVVADSFHATAFSLQFRKQFMVFYPEQASIRMRDLLALTNLKDRGTENSVNIEQIDAHIDYDSVTKKLEEIRIQDAQFLKRIAAEINQEK